MSRIAKNRIKIPADTTCKYENNILFAKGKLGEMTLNINPLFNIDLKEEEIFVFPVNEKDKENPIWGTMHAHVANVVKGVSEGFKKKLKLVGVGYSVEKKGDYILINVGFSHPIYVQIPSGISIEIPDNTTIIINGSNKQNVGDLAAKIRSIRMPEPYKGKGIKYSDETIRRKAGKVVGGATGV